MEEHHNMFSHVGFFFGDHWSTEINRMRCSRRFFCACRLTGEVGTNRKATCVTAESFWFRTLAALPWGERLSHRRVYRPWGTYESVDSDQGFQVKRIVVNPGARLSLQKHAHRAEHWVVVRGKARVTRDREIFDLVANQSAYIPLGAVHRLENPGTEPLHLIEVQAGDYLGEDDIVRLEDNYGRV